LVRLDGTVREQCPWTDSKAGIMPSNASRGEKPAAKKLVKVEKKLALELERSMIGSRLEKV